MQTIWRNVQLVNNTEEELRKIASNSMENNNRFAMITARETLRYFRFLLGDGSIYMPPDDETSSFYPLLVSIPVRLSFEYDRKPFNELYVIEILNIEKITFFFYFCFSFLSL